VAIPSPRVYYNIERVAIDFPYRDVGCWEGKEVSKGEEGGEYTYIVFETKDIFVMS